jgi:PAS domain S-box-containing protein
MGPDLAGGLTLRLARELHGDPAAPFVPVVAVVDDATAGAEALRDEGAADYLLRDRMGPEEVTRALLIAHARRDAVDVVRHQRDALGTALAQGAEALAVLQHVVDALPLVVISTDAEGRIRYIAGSALDAFGITADGLEGESVFGVVAHHAEAVACARRAREGEPSDVHLDLGEHRFRVRFAPLHDRRGRPDGLVIVGHDVTEREDAERMRQRITHALDAAGDAIGLADVDGMALFVNRAMEELLGYSLEAMNAAGGPAALYRDADVAGAVFAAVRAGERWQGEVTLAGRSGADVRVRLHAAAVYDEAGELIGLIGIHRPLQDA